MSERSVENINVGAFEPLITPDQLKREIPLSAAVCESVLRARSTIRDILDGNDHRLFLVVGPCSIHDTRAALEYAQRLKHLADEVQDSLFLVMRVYFEKPRTTTGWKGLVNDPHMNDSFRIQEGLHIARRLLVDISAMGLPAATEALDPISPQYLQDLIAWSAIGARTTESQTHREMASGLSCAVGFKNGTDGGFTVAVNALKSVSGPHRFLGINHQGEVAVIHTRGNRHAHIVLRGGSQGPNFDSMHIALCERELGKAGVACNIVVDCSHANSDKDPSLQPLVLENVGNQILEGNRSIVGAMLESNLEAGNQPIPADLSALKYGVSVTDACMDWSTTETAIRALRKKVRKTLIERRVGRIPT
ncbi:MAG: 3-deoxy-7-phosphoheptulonate synthase [Gammaproteobacteria bacterium]|jgi:3-deoxy-7-phosphoheptulonate synthase|nr:3-deoxy-7-phosphoheptulonate synthase [Gammaproteobacteria bacterium]MBP6050613.1 3-deoxy-7-phosphoheptulonate synthase [Pseudomonadales bacterium]MBK6583460.1 3-deoxy-7-phosphoheptulonate synthase [Gammaproteobacteria bacterium]MBK7521076.1 3-deoxy-7-phosphoheptulonate synthase [Gammaproteobacteria bacterium]MBK7728850.1 3-deoxy-7-phosphoheptulonate synthase [Gammaproteobacteria bacterium]